MDGRQQIAPVWVRDPGGECMGDFSSDQNTRRYILLYRDFGQANHGFEGRGAPRTPFVYVGAHVSPFAPRLARSAGSSAGQPPARPPFFGWWPGWRRPSQTHQRILSFGLSSGFLSWRGWSSQMRAGLTRRRPWWFRCPATQGLGPLSPERAWPAMGWAMLGLPEGDVLLLLLFA